MALLPPHVTTLMWGEVDLIVRQEDARRQQRCESLSAQQLADILGEEVKPSVAALRSFLRGNDEVVFTQIRRGGFVLARNYEIGES